MINVAMQKVVNYKILRGFLDLIILRFLQTQPMHGYQIITSIRNKFGLYFGPSTIYPLLNILEEKGFIKSQWDLSNERPRKVYGLTHEGEDLLCYTETSFQMIRQKIQAINVTLQVEGFVGKGLS